MEYFITTVGLLIYGQDTEINESFYVKWEYVQTYDTQINRETTGYSYSMVFKLNDGTTATYTTEDVRFWNKLIKKLNSLMLTEIMFSDYRARFHYSERP